jgi:hypothetical protein
MQKKYLDKATSLQCQLNDSIISVNGSEASTTESDGPQVYERAEMAITRSLAGFSEVVDTEMAALQGLRQRIDGMWVEELILQILAELFQVVIETACCIEHDGNAVTAICEASRKLHVIVGWPLQCVTDRAANRQVITMEGGLEFAEKHVSEVCSDAHRVVEGLLQQLSQPEQVSSVKRRAQEFVSHMAEELESISYCKEANTFMMLDMEENIKELEVAEHNFALSVVQEARVGPENVLFQERALQTLARVLEAYALKQRSGLHLINVLGDCVNFVLESLRSQRCQNTSLQEDACRVLGHLATHGIEYSLIRDSCIPALLNTMQVQCDQSSVQVCACGALLQIAGSSVQNKMLVAKLVSIDVISNAIHNHPMDTQLQQVGIDLLSVLVIAGAVSKAF